MTYFSLAERTCTTAPAVCRRADEVGDSNPFITTRFGSPSNAWVRPFFRSLTGVFGLGPSHVPGPVMRLRWVSLPPRAGCAEPKYFREIRTVSLSSGYGWVHCRTRRSVWRCDACPFRPEKRVALRCVSLPPRCPFRPFRPSDEEKRVALRCVSFPPKNSSREKAHDTRAHDLCRGRRNNHSYSNVC